MFNSLFYCADSGLLDQSKFLILCNFSNVTHYYIIACVRSTKVNIIYVRVVYCKFQTLLQIIYCSIPPFTSKFYVVVKQTCEIMSDHETAQNIYLDIYNVLSNKEQ